MQAISHQLGFDIQCTGTGKAYDANSLSHTLLGSSRRVLVWQLFQLKNKPQKRDMPEELLMQELLTAHILNSCFQIAPSPLQCFAQFLPTWSKVTDLV